MVSVSEMDVHVDRLPLCAKFTKIQLLICLQSVLQLALLTFARASSGQNVACKSACYTYTICNILTTTIPKLCKFKYCVFLIDV